MPYSIASRPPPSSLIRPCKWCHLNLMVALESVLLRTYASLFFDKQGGCRRFLAVTYPGASETSPPACPAAQPQGTRPKANLGWIASTIYLRPLRQTRLQTVRQAMMGQAAAKGQGRWSILKGPCQAPSNQKQVSCHVRLASELSLLLHKVALNSCKQTGTSLGILHRQASCVRLNVSCKSITPRCEHSLCLHQQLKLPIHK